MLPNIDPAANTPAVTTVTSPQVRRPQAEKALEAYKTSSGEGVSFETTRETARTAERGTRIQPARDTDKFKKISGADQAELTLQFTREEREVFLTAMTGRESTADMSDQEQDLLQKTSERVQKLIEDADARDLQTRERVDKAVKEWFTRLSNGKQPPGNLLTLIRQAAAGDFD